MSIVTTPPILLNAPIYAARYSGLYLQPVAPQPAPQPPVEPVSAETPAEQPAPAEPEKSAVEEPEEKDPFEDIFKLFQSR